MIALLRSPLRLSWRVLGGTALVATPLIYSLIAWFASLRTRQRFPAERPRRP